MKRGFKDNTAVIIPVYNEEKVIYGVVEEVLKRFHRVICVNDGSRDASESEIRRTRAVLINHPINMGQGAALQTGLEFARNLKEIKYFVTFDADGQHSLEDVEAMLAEIKNKKVDVVLGSRFLGIAENIKPIKKAILKLAILFTNVTTGLDLTDTHNGLRVFSREAAERLEITMPDMAHASEILSLIKENKLTYTEIPVSITYSDYSTAKGQSIFNAVNIAFDLMFRKGSK